MILRVLLGGGAAAIVAAAAAHSHMLTRSGAVAAAVIGSIAVAAGWSWGVLLVVFFALASLLSAFRAQRKRELTRGVIAKSGTRDAVQVVSNGGVFAVASAAWLVAGNSLWLGAAAGAIAAAAADSWATELGVALGGEPRSIVSGRATKRGMSGGVTLAGSLGGVAGAAATAATVLIIGWPPVVAAAAILAGVIGMITDSVLGATIQTRRYCASCATQTEQAVHYCGHATEISGGSRWMSNDAVNALATLTGALVGGVVLLVLA